jgi:hypothetical protein
LLLFLCPKPFYGVSDGEILGEKKGKQRIKREYQSGKTGGVYGGKTDYSIGDKYIVTFKYEKISDNTYKIILPAGLAPGEYCFVYLSNNANNNPYFVALGQNKNKVFDFGVK